MKMRVAENDKFIKDSDNFAILCTDRTAIGEHERKLAQLQRQKNQEVEINNIKSDISDIKDLLSTLLEST